MFEMNFATAVVLFLVIAAAGLALRSVIGRVKRGDLCGTCGNSCGGSCGHCQNSTKQSVISETEIETVIANIKCNKI